MRTISDIEVGKDRGGWLQSAIGVESTKYDRAGLQIVISFGLQSVTKILKNWLQSAMGLQTATDYKVIQYMVYKVLKSYIAIDLAFFFLFIMLIFSMKGSTFWSTQNLL